MSKSSLFIFLFLVLFSSYSFEQELPTETKQQLESLVESTESEPESDGVLQQLVEYKKHPVNINTVSADELRSFSFLNDLQIYYLINHRKLFGYFINIYELQSIPTWSVQTIEKLLPFIYVAQPVAISKLFQNRFTDGATTALIRASRVIEKDKKDVFKGDDNHYLLRYHYRYKNLLQYGLTADKDAGEPFFKGKQKNGFDFYSLHLFAREMGLVKAVAIGDFTVNLGQGLVQWQSLAFKKSADVLSIKRQSSVLRPYTSAGEFYFNRGAGITLKKNAFEATVFGSVKGIDATVYSDTLQENYFSSFYTFGLHRTEAEMEKKNALQQTSFGGNISYIRNAFSIGFNGVQHQFSAPLIKRDEPYNRFSVKGNKWSNVSVDYSYTHKNLHLFGEAAADKLFQKAFINGALISVDPKVDVSILHRFIGMQYQSVYGNAFTENTAPSNESGFYLGTRIRPNSDIVIDGYADVYTFPFLKYRTDGPGRGRDYLLQITYSPTKDFQIYTRYKTDSKQINESGITTNYLLYKPRQNWRVHFSYNLSPKIKIRNRVDVLWYNKASQSSEEGFLVYAEMHYQLQPRLSANIRVQYFNTDGYNSRLYTFENDVLYAYSVPFYRGKGYRYYTNTHYNLNKFIQLWLRCAQTFHNSNSFSDSPQKRISTEVKIEAVLGL